MALRISYCIASQMWPMLMQTGKSGTYAQWLLGVRSNITENPGGIGLPPSFPLAADRSVPKPFRYPPATPASLVKLRTGQPNLLDYGPDRSGGHFSAVPR
jgi:hypothetical protein